MPLTPCVFCAVSAVMTEAPKTPSAANVFRSAWIPAPPDESEPAMVSATGVVIGPLAGIQAFASGACSVLARGVIASKFLNAILKPMRAPGDDSDGSLLRPVQMQTRPVLCRRQRARRGRDRLRDLFHRGRLRPAGEVLRRQRHRYRPFRQREGAGHPRHPGHPHHHHIQGVRYGLDQDLSPSFTAFLGGGGGPSTGGSDLRYSAMPARSSGGNCEVFLITRAIGPPAVSPSGISPVSRKLAMSSSLHSASPFLGVLGTPPPPSGFGPPAKRCPAMMPPRKFRGL